MSTPLLTEANRGDETTVRLRRRLYALSFVRNVLGRDYTSVKPDLAERVLYALTRTEELENPVRDEWGNWEYEFSMRARAGEPAVPWLDELVQATVPSSAFTAHIEPTWPQGRPFALCLTHDVDSVSSRNHEKKFFRRLTRVGRAQGPKHIAGLQAAGSLYRLATGMGRPDQLGRFEEWLKLESRHGFRSTWYFLPSEYAKVHVYDMDYAYDDTVVFEGREMPVSEMMKAIHALGGDVGVHGSYLSACDAALLADQVLQVERAVDHPVRSVRQHYLRYDSALTPSVQALAGCDNDSTQGFNTSIGCRAGTSFPFRAWDHQVSAPSRVLEIPMHIMDVALLRSASAEPDKAIRMAVDLMDRVATVGGCLTLNWHPNLIQHERLFQIYEVILQEAAAKNAWGCSASELTGWWNAREGRLEKQYLASKDVVS